MVDWGGWHATCCHNVGMNNSDVVRFAERIPLRWGQWFSRSDCFIYVLRCRAGGGIYRRAMPSGTFYKIGKAKNIEERTRAFKFRHIEIARIKGPQYFIDQIERMLLWLHHDVKINARGFCGANEIFHKIKLTETDYDLLRIQGLVHTHATRPSLFFSLNEKKVQKKRNFSLLWGV